MIRKSLTHLFQGFQSTFFPNFIEILRGDRIAKNRVSVPFFTFWCQIVIEIWMKQGKKKKKGFKDHWDHGGNVNLSIMANRHEFHGASADTDFNILAPKLEKLKKRRKYENSPYYPDIWTNVQLLNDKKYVKVVICLD